ncbi:MAG: pseudouridine synthase [Lutibacter sp.]|nr:MAG: pseudouridine synthase [Lutibacter sp.]
MILYEDEFTIAVNKPNNVLVHHSKMANNKTEEKSLVQLVFDTYGKKYYPIHRLDRKTSGILLFAKEKQHVATFQKLFVSNQIKKTYIGVVRGFINPSGTIDSDVKGRDSDVYKAAVTDYSILNKKLINTAVTPYESSRYSLVELLPKTGRLHQLRIHLNKISHPLIGDPKYGDRFHNRMFETEFNCNKMFLHAQKLAFKHPFLDQNIEIKAPFPEDWHTISTKFGWSLP